MQEILNSLPGPMQVNETIPVIMVIFLIMIAVLNTLIFKPLTATMDERARRIKEGADARENARRTVEESEAKYQADMIAARKTAQARRQEMLAEVEAVRDSQLNAAREEVAQMMVKFNEELDQQVNDAEASLDREAQEIAQRITAKILARAS